MSLPLLNSHRVTPTPRSCQLCGRNPVHWEQAKPTRFVWFTDCDGVAEAGYRYVCWRCYTIGTLGHLPHQLGEPDGIDRMVIVLSQGQRALIERFRRESVDIQLPDGGVMPFRPSPNHSV